MPTQTNAAPPAVVSTAAASSARAAAAAYLAPFPPSRPANATHAHAPAAIATGGTHSRVAPAGHSNIQSGGANG